MELWVQLVAEFSDLGPTSVQLVVAAAAILFISLLGLARAGFFLLFARPAPGLESRTGLAERCQENKINLRMKLGLGNLWGRSLIQEVDQKKTSMK